jgi:hypothetical protein
MPTLLSGATYRKKCPDELGRRPYLDETGKKLAGVQIIVFLLSEESIRWMYTSLKL